MTYVRHTTYAFKNWCIKGFFCFLLRCFRRTFSYRLPIIFSVYGMTLLKKGGRRRLFISKDLFCCDFNATMLTFACTQSLELYNSTPKVRSAPAPPYLNESNFRTFTFGCGHGVWKSKISFYDCNFLDDGKGFKSDYLFPNNDCISIWEKKNYGQLSRFPIMISLLIYISIWITLLILLSILSPLNSPPHWLALMDIFSFGVGEFLDPLWPWRRSGRFIPRSLVTIEKVRACHS